MSRKRKKQPDDAIFDKYLHNNDDEDEDEDEDTGRLISDGTEPADDRSDDDDKDDDKKTGKKNKGKFKKENIIAVATGFSAWYIYEMLKYGLNKVNLGDIPIRIITFFVVYVVGRMYAECVLKKEQKRVADRQFILTHAGVILFFAVTATFLSTFITRNIGDAGMQARTDTLNAIGSKSTLVLTLAMSVLLSPIVEEIIYRQYMFGQLAKVDRKAALIVSSAVFAVCHGTLSHLYIAFFGGMIFANIYDKTKNVWWNILAHIYYNFLILILGLFVSPYLPDTFYSIWPAIIMSGISVVAVWYLFKMPALSYKADDSLSKELTDEQKAERKRTADIVDQVMNEQKEEKKNRYRNITSVTDENDVDGYDADGESDDTDDDVYDIESDVKRTLLKHSQE